MRWPHLTPTPSRSRCRPTQVQLGVPLEIVTNTISKRKTDLAIMCDRGDLGVAVDRGRPIKAYADTSPVLEMAGNPVSPTTDLRSSILDPSLPTVTIYERIAAGLGFSARLYEIHDELLAAAQALIEGCACPSGCPACVGPVFENESTQLETKRLALALLRVMSR